MAIDPARLRQIYVNKGDLVLWDFCSKCSEECPVYERCGYVKKGYCTAESKYLKAVTDPVIKELLQAEQGPVLTILEWLDYGLKLVPLWHDLARVCIALSGADGRVSGRVLTLMREKRQIIRAIDRLEIQRTLMDKFEELGVVPEKNVTLPGEGGLTEEQIAYYEEHGDPDFAERE